MTATAPSRPVLRYHGGKWVLSRWVIRHMPEHRIYVEPFGGAASVLMRKPRSHSEVYNDLDSEIVNVFRVLRCSISSEKLRKLLDLTPWSRDEFYESYLPCEDPIEQARRTVARSFMAFGTTNLRKNRTGFRGKAYRENQTGVQDWLNYPAQLEVFCNRLRGVVIDNRPALEVIAQQDTEDTLFYCDPPYPHSTRSSVQWPSHNDTAYAHEMTDDDHRALAACLLELKGMVVLSGYNCPLYEELFGEWQRIDRRAHADGARDRTESLWFSPSAYAGISQSRMQF